MNAIILVLLTLCLYLDAKVSTDSKETYDPVKVRNNIHILNKDYTAKDWSEFSLPILSLYVLFSFVPLSDSMNFTFYEVFSIIRNIT